MDVQSGSRWKRQAVARPVAGRLTLFSVPGTPAVTLHRLRCGTSKLAGAGILPDRPGSRLRRTSCNLEGRCGWRALRGHESARIGIPSVLFRPANGSRKPLAGSPEPAIEATERTMRAAEIKKGNVVEHEGKVYQIRDIERSSPQGRGGNVKFRFIMYSVPGAQKLDVTLGAEDELKETEVTRRPVSYSYMDGEAFVFMDIEDYTQYTLDANVVGDSAGYIADGIEGCQIQLIEDAPVAVLLPQSVTLEVVDTAPELKGATATKRPKPAKLSTGLEIQVPEYITTGEKIVVNTTTGEFAGRA
jgi:elongation factor P